jgi:hypothetical protein
MPESPARRNVTIVLRRPERSLAAGASREEIQLAQSAEPADLETVRQFCAAHHLQIDRESAPERSVRASGDPQSIEAAFPLNQIPRELQGAAIAILGLDPGPAAKHH